MSTILIQQPEQDDIVIDLRDPYWAALLAWLVPGAGHLYQKRTAKGILFMVCILSTFLYGMLVGDGRVVYASWRPNDYRWHFIPQMGVGAPAIPAILQAARVGRVGDPYFVVRERYPQGGVDQLGRDRSLEVIRDGDYRGVPVPPHGREYQMLPTIKDGFMAPPARLDHLNRQFDPARPDVLSMWHLELGHRFEIGTLFTMVAGLLNLLAIYDAFAGPIIPLKRKKKKSNEETDEQAEPNAQSSESEG